MPTTMSSKALRAATNGHGNGSGVANGHPQDKNNQFGPEPGAPTKSTSASDLAREPIEPVHTPDANDQLDDRTDNTAPKPPKIVSIDKENQIEHADIAGLYLLGPTPKFSTSTGKIVSTISEDWVKAVQQDEAAKIKALRTYTALVQSAFDHSRHDAVRAGVLKKVVTARYATAENGDMVKMYGKPDKGRFDERTVKTKVTYEKVEEEGELAANGRDKGVDGK